MPRVRQLLVSVVIVMVLASGLGLASPSTATAASTTNVKVCFKWSNGAAAVGFTLTMYQANGGTWVRYKTAKTNSGGCATFSYVARPGAYYVQAYRSYISYGYVNGDWTLPCHVIDAYYGYTDVRYARNQVTTSFGTHYISSYENLANTCY